jgi:hypothetical protein
MTTMRHHHKTNKTIIQSTDLHEVTTVRVLVLWCTVFTQTTSVTSMIIQTHSFQFLLVGPSSFSIFCKPVVNGHICSVHR